MNYYEMLGVSSSANSTEIEQAIDTRYNQWRALVTHHDPNVVNQANQELQKLETIRGTLTDVNKRAVYDAGIVIGDLADPEALLRKVAPPISPPIRNVQASAPQTMARTDVWLCPKCQTSNAIGTRFCRTCGNALGRECPNCGKLIEKIADYCSECGVNVESAERAKRQQAEEEAHLRALEQQHAAQIQREEVERAAMLAPTKRSSDTALILTGAGCLTSFFGPLSFISIIPFAFAILQARKVLGGSQIFGDEQYRRKSRWAFWISAISLGLIVAGIILYACSLLFSVLSNLSTR